MLFALFDYGSSLLNSLYRTLPMCSKLFRPFWKDFLPRRIQMFVSLVKVHEAFDVVQVAVYASFDYTFKSLIKRFACGFNKDAERKGAAFFQVFDVGDDYDYFSIFNFVEGFELLLVRIFL